MVTLPKRQGGRILEATTDLPWFAVQVKPQLTRQVAESLRSKGYEAFTPCSSHERKWCDRTRNIDVPVFPGYVFVRLNPVYRLPVLTTPGVQSFVGIGKVPELVDEQEIAAVRQIVHPGVAFQAAPYPTVGDSVLIEHGPLAGVRGTSSLLKKTPYVVVSVELIERSVAVEMDRDSVRTLAVPHLATLQSATTRTIV